MMSHNPPDPALNLGARIRALRIEQRLSLAELAAGTAVSEATMSRIENGQSQVSAPHLYGLAQLLSVDIAAFFEPDIGMYRGTRSITRAGAGALFSTPRLHAQLLNGDLQRKAMHPFLNSTRADALPQVGGLSAHAGEEFLYVLQGPLLFCSQAYTPLRLETGDSFYFDASDPHAYLTDPGKEAVFLVVSSAPNP